MTALSELDDDDAGELLELDALEAIVAAIVAAVSDASHPDHFHVCGFWRAEGDETCESSCVCACGAVVRAGPTYDVDGRWAWRQTDGTWCPFPDPRWKDDSATL